MQVLCIMPSAFVVSHPLTDTCHNQTLSEHFYSRMQKNWNPCWMEVITFAFREVAMMTMLWIYLKRECVWKGFNHFLHCVLPVLWDCNCSSCIRHGRIWCGASSEFFCSFLWNFLLAFFICQMLLNIHTHIFLWLHNHMHMHFRPD